MSMNLVIGSCFRDSSDEYMDAYFSRIYMLRQSTSSDVKIRLLLVEGDSVDSTTWVRLNRKLGEHNLSGSQVILRDHGHPVYGSVATPERLSSFAYAANGIWENLEPSDDLLFYVESDIIWSPQTLAAMVQDLQPSNADWSIIAPMVHEISTGGFYDTWGFRRHGIHWTKHDGHPTVDAGWQGIVEMDSVGSCLLIRTEVARQFRLTPEESLVGFCKLASQAGYRIGMDTRLEVEHP